MSKRAVSAVVRLVVPAGAAKPSPPVGPALGQHGVNIMSFCKDFNAKTSEHKAETPVPVVIEIYGDKTFEWTMKTPPTSYFVARAAGVKTCSQRPGHATAGRINLKHAYEIAKVKASDKGLGNVSLMSLTKSVLGTARSMGVEWTMKTPPTSYFVARAAGVKTCSQRPGHATAGRINLKHAYEIAKVKASDKGLGNVSLMSLTKSVLGTARSMGVEVTDPRK